MSADSRLVALLGSLQSSHFHQGQTQLLSSAVTVLSLLNSTYNVTLLTTHLLSSPAIWAEWNNLQTCLRFMSIFQTALSTRLGNENTPQNQQLGGRTSQGAWIKAVLKGATEQTPKWRHIIVITGLLVGINSQKQGISSRDASETLSNALVKALNLSLEENGVIDGIEAHGMTLAINYGFPHLKDIHRSRIEYNRLLPVLIGSAFFSQEGFQGAQFLAPINQDVIQCQATQFSWSTSSPSFQHLSTLSSSPLISVMGPLSRLIGHAAEHVYDPWLLKSVIEDLSAFTNTLMNHWRWNKISEIHISEEHIYLNQRTVAETLPVLWKVLRSVLFSVIVILRAITGRIINDRTLGATEISLLMSTKSLHILRNLVFISSRLGPNAFSQYTFVYLTSVDIVSSSPAEAESFVHAIRPTVIGHVSDNPFERSLDLFFLNVSEHLALSLPPRINEDLVCAVAAPYLICGGNKKLLELYEAAHSAMLAVFLSPQNAGLTGLQLPSYIDTLFKVYPSGISVRQFRFAFKTLLQITSPPSPLSTTHPLLAETLLDLLYHRASVQPSNPRPAPYTASAHNQSISAVVTEYSQGEMARLQSPRDVLDERSGLTLALLDSLPYISLTLLTTWLPFASDLLHKIDDPKSRETCRLRFWEVLSSGEMDVERSQICATWWNTYEGQRRVMLDQVGDYRMSGGIQSSV